ncbi:MAG: hypothetical protein K9G49_14810, partial [Taibaiella sp.]|nr:hypothetical protein [Taibaiella sp.]
MKVLPSVLVIAIVLIGTAFKSIAISLPTITLTSQEVMWVDANKCNAEGPRGAWLSYVITNPNATAITGVTVTFSGFTGTHAAYFIAPHDITRTFTSIGAGQSVPVYYYVDYSDVCNHPVGGGNPYTGFTANYILSVASSAGTATRNGTISTKELLTASAAGQAISSPLSTSGIFVGQIFTQTVTYTFGNNTDLFFQPNGEKDFPDLCLRLIKDSVSATTGSVTGILGQTNALAFPGASTSATDNTITIVYTWQVLCTNTFITLHPWAAAKSGMKYKYTGFGATSAVIDAVQAISISKSVFPTTLPTPSSDGGFGNGIVEWTVTLSNSSTSELLVNKISDVIPGCMTLTSAIAASSDVTASNSYSIPTTGSSGAQSWVGAVPINSSQWQYKVPAGSSIDLVYRTNVSGCNNLSNYTNSATATIGTTTVGPSTATICFPPTISYAPGVYCPTGTATVTRTGLTGGTFSALPGLAINPSSGSIDLAASSAGIYTVTYTVSGALCPTATTIVTVNPLPATISGSNNICLGFTSNYTNAVSGGVWSSSSGSIASIGSSTGVVTGNAIGTCTLTYTLPTGCYITKAVTVSANPASITGTATACVGATATLSSATSGGSWSSSNVGVATVGSTGIVTGVSSATTIISYILPTGCYTTRIFTVSPSPSAIAGTASICVGYSSTLSNSVSVGNWTSSNPSIATVGASTGVVNGVAGGTAIITYTISNGCFTTKVVTINTVPPSIGGSSQVCAGANITLTNSATGGSWSSSNPSVATIGGSDGLVSGVAAGTARITYTLSVGCAVTKVITVNAAAPSISGSSNLCLGGTLTLSVVGATGTWSSSNTSVATVGASTGVITSISAGIATISYTVSTGCFSLKAITVNELPAISAGSNVTICNGSSTVLSATGGTSYTWTPATALSCTACANPTANPTSTITYTVTGTNANGCVNTATVMVSVNPLAATISGTASVCAGLTTALSCSTIGGTWTSTNTGVANIGLMSGLVSAIAAGTTTISYILPTGCFTTRVVTVSPAVTASATSTNVNCNGGSNGTIDLTPAGGTTPYTYLWNGGVTTQDRTGLAAGTYSVTVTDANGCTTTTSRTITQPATLTASATSTNVNCNGGANGTIDLTVAGGTTAYSYVWSNGATTQDLSGLSAGTYSVTVTDANGCTTTASRTITQPTVLTATTASTNALCSGCNNGTAGVTPAGGTPAYTYLWNNGAITQNVTGLVAGNYSVTVTDANGCTVVKTITITQPAVFTATVTGTNVNCFGGNNGTADLTVSGGTTPYTYVWSNGATTQDLSGLTAGTYSVVITDANGYTLNKSVTITQPTVLAASATNTNVSCNGGSNGSIDVTVTGGTTAYSYTWSNGATTQDISGLSAGTYSVLVTDANGCTATVTKTITHPTTLTASATTTNVNCNGGSNGTIDLTPAGGTTPYTYLWNGGVTTQDRTGLAAGTYSVTVTDANGCTTTTSKTITQPAALTASATSTNVNCNGGANGTIDLTVAGGTTAYSYVWSNGATTQDLSGLSAGTYSVTVTDANGCTTTASRTITQPTVLSATTASTNALCSGCNNGTAGVTPAGGTPAYTYLWSNGATTQNVTGLVAGNYSVTVTDANGCTVIKTITITQPAVFTATVTGTNVNCFGGNNGTADLTVSGGTTPYTYVWSNGATTQDLSGLTAG